MTIRLPSIVAALVVLAAGCGSAGSSKVGADGGAGAGGGAADASAGADGAAGTAAEAAADLAAEASSELPADVAPESVADAAVEIASDVVVEARPEVPADVAASDVGQDVDARPSAAGTIVPLYTYPSDPSWTAIVTARKAHPTVRVVAVVNPNSGPGTAKIAAFETGIAKLLAADIVVIGYVATGYTARGTTAVEADIDRWKAFYPQLQGIFFDEQSNKATDVPFYKTVSQYAKAAGLAYTVGNPGADTAEAYVGALDTMLIYESKGLPSLSALGGWHAKYAPTNFGVIPYGAAFDAAFVATARKTVGYVFIQNDDLPNPWDSLPPFFADLLGALE